MNWVLIKAKFVPSDNDYSAGRCSIDEIDVLNRESCSVGGYLESRAIVGDSHLILRVVVLVFGFSEERNGGSG